MMLILRELDVEMIPAAAFVALFFHWPKRAVAEFLAAVIGDLTFNETVGFGSGYFILHKAFNDANHFGCIAFIAVCSVHNVVPFLVAVAAKQADESCVFVRKTADGLPDTGWLRKAGRLAAFGYHAKFD
jgi:hypothetical protein